MPRNSGSRQSRPAFLLCMLLWQVLAVVLLTSCSNLPICEANSPPSTYPRLLLTGDTIYLQTEDLSLYALRMSDGSLRWKYHLPGRAMEAETADDMLYLAYYSGTFPLYALRASDGKLLWKMNGFQDDLRMLGVTHGVLYVYISSRHMLLALRETDGTRIWQSHVEEYPDAFQATSEMVYSVEIDGAVTALQASDGALAWQEQVGKPPYVDSGIWPAVKEDENPLTVEDGIVYVNAGQQIHALRASDGAVLWLFPTKAQRPLHLITDHSQVYVMSDHLYALRSGNGGILWQFPPQGFPRNHPAGITNDYMRASFLVGAEISYANNVVYMYTSGRAAALRAGDGKFLWYYQVDMPYTPSTVMVASDTAVYFLSVDEGASSILDALRVSDGKPLWGDSLRDTQLVFADGAIYAGKAGYNGECWGQVDSQLDKLRASDGTRLWHFESGDVTSPAL